MRSDLEVVPTKQELVKTVKIRFPNEPTFQYLQINMNEFEADKIFEDEVFGWLEGDYVAIGREDYEENENN